MRITYKNFFFILGVVAIVISLCTFDMSWDEVRKHVLSAGYWFPAVLILWAFIYLVNACAWRLLILKNKNVHIGFLRIYKYTITGYALNSITPVGVLGGEPYRIMELTPYMGATRASGCVIQYSMMHIFSHFCFWVFSIILFLACYGTKMSISVGLFIALCCIFCTSGLWLFFKGYRTGVAMHALNVFSHIPLIGNKIRTFKVAHAKEIENVDIQITTLYLNHKRTFLLTLFFEFMARILTCMELYFIMRIMTAEVSIIQCILMHAFSSLMSNLMFFVPMQMGTREGSMAMFVKAIHMKAVYGVLTGLITRLRELIWTAIGLILIKVGNSYQHAPVK